MQEVTSEQFFEATKDAESYHINMDDMGWHKNGVMVAKRTGKRSISDVERYFLTSDAIAGLTQSEQSNDEYNLIGYAEDGKGFIYEVRHHDRISNPVAIYIKKID